jgi:hypothetical protein
MILAFTLGHIIAGVLLGTRFRVIVLAPAMLVSIIGLAAAMGLAGSGLAETAVTILVALGALQIGFLAGAALRDRQMAPLPRRSPRQAGHLVTGVSAPMGIGPHGPVRSRGRADHPASG